MDQAEVMVGALGVSMWQAVEPPSVGLTTNPRPMADRRDHTNRPRLGHRQLMVKRVLDVTVALFLLAVTAPVMAVVATLVSVTSRGPVLFRQQRVGRSGTVFEVLKFRTMIDGTDQIVRRDPALWAVYVANDHKLPHAVARYTPCGQLLRRFGVDELPQLVNVLRGQMSLVGNRPIEQTQLNERCESSQRLYGLLPPGLTGLWQVTGRSTITDDARIVLEDSYIRTWNIKQDLSLLIRTPVAVLRFDDTR
jgi:exopolysaccharide production protein ExoY